MRLDCTIVIPTIGRESLQDLVSALDHRDGPQPAEVVVVDDRIDPDPPLRLASTLPARVLVSGGEDPPLRATSDGAPPVRGG